ncbi:MAG: S9 family peptidase [Bacteroidales bacterium]|nr:S9 family peptidase [Bacteroidales bacterium]
MKCRIVLAGIFFLSFSFSVLAQLFTIEDIETGRLSYLRPENLENLQWRGEAHAVVFSVNDTLYEYAVEQKLKKVLLTLDQLNQALEPVAGQVFGTMPEVKFIGKDVIYLEGNGADYFYNLTDNSCSALVIPVDAEQKLLNEEQFAVAFLQNSAIWIALRDGTLKQVTNDTVQGIVNADYIYRQEFGIDRGMFWSETGKYLAWYRKDERQVEKFPLIGISSVAGEDRQVHYPMAGRTMENTELWIYSMDKGRSVKICPPNGAGVYLTNLSWSPDDTYVYIQHLNRGQDTLSLKCYSSLDGSYLNTLFTEVNPKYVEPMYPVRFLTNDPDVCYYQSERSGYNQLYEYDFSTRKLKQLTYDSWDITGVVGSPAQYSAKPGEQAVYYMATGETPLENQLFRLDLKEGKSSQITPDAGTHKVLFSEDMSLFIDKFSSREVPNRISVYTRKGEILLTLLDAASPVEAYQLADEELGTLKAGDGVSDIYYRLTKPLNFNPEKKYPLIVYVYGGPHVQLITNSWMGRIDYLQQYFAQHGYASLIIDSRGSDNRGRSFEDVIFRQHGIPQREDQLKGIDFIRSLGWVDTARIGIHGWSYGGFMTLNMMVSAPDIYKVGVAGGSVTNWALYEVMYGERYMDTPGENPEGYGVTNLIARADQLKGKLLLIHCGKDDTVLPQHTLQFMKACIDAGKPVDFFLYPEHEHNVRGNDRLHLTRKITQYFFENL